MLIASK
ncbi:hypothetical protein GQ607_016756 [Colletotrichum asianum]|nr:hypothetical protein GQ607_016756 [Colletotrichum asianum]